MNGTFLRNLLASCEIVQVKCKSKCQGSFLAGSIYDRVVAEDHLLCRFGELIYLEALAEGVSDCYTDVGRPSWPPEQMLKIVILQYLYDVSYRRMEEQLRYNLGFKFFCGMAADEVGPDHSTLSRFHGRVVTRRFARQFNISRSERIENGS